MKTSKLKSKSINLINFVFTILKDWPRANHSKAVFESGLPGHARKQLLRTLGG